MAAAFDSLKSLLKSGKSAGMFFSLVFPGFLLFALLTSCGALFFPPLEVVWVSVKEGYVTPESINQTLSVRFSSSLNRNSAAAAARLRSDGEDLPGRVSAAGDVLTFTPLSPFEKNRDYEFTVSGELEDLRGVSLEAPLVRRFSTRVGRGGPAVTLMNPAPESVVPAGVQEIALWFTEAVSYQSLLKALSLSPAVDFALDFHGDRVRVLPTERLKTGQRYTVKVSSQLSDLSGNPAVVPFAATFLNGTDRNPPAFTVLSAEDPEGEALRSLDEREPSGRGTTYTPTEVNLVESPAVLLLVFDEEVNMASLLPLIAVGNGAAVKVTPDKKTMMQAELTVTGAWGTETVLTVKAGITDTAGNATTRRRRFALRLAGEKTRPPKVEGSVLRAAGMTWDIVPEANFSTLVFPAAAFPLNTVRGGEWEVTVRISAAAQTVSPVSVMKALRITAENNALQVDIRRVTVDAADTDIAGGKLVTFRGMLEVTNKDSGGLLRFTLGKGLSDDLGNTLEKEWEVVLNKG